MNKELLKKLNLNYKKNLVTAKSDFLMLNRRCVIVNAYFIHNHENFFFN